MISDLHSLPLTMARHIIVFAVVLIVLEYAVRLHAARTHCHHHSCGPAHLCVLTQSDLGSVHGACVSYAEQFTHGYQRCNEIEAPTPHTTCVCTYQICIDRTIKAMEAAVTTASSTQLTTESLQTTTPKEYPTCVGMQCDKYYPHCHLYDLNTYIEGRCVPFKVGDNCKSIKDLLGRGCTCSNTQCSLDILSSHAILVTHPVTTPTTTVATTRMSIQSTVLTSTQQEGYECFGQICFSQKNYCHIYSYNGDLEGRCMPFSVWPICHQKTDLSTSGCECISSECVKTFERVAAMTASTTRSTTVRKTQSSVLTTLQQTTHKLESSTIQQTNTTTTEINEALTTTSYAGSNDLKTTKAQETTTEEDLCQDKPGIDCKLLNSTNICANPFSHQYCAAFCGHCTPKAINVAFG